MKLRRIYWFIIIAVVVIVGFFAYKGVNLNYYTFPAEKYDEILLRLKFDDTITVKQTDVLDDNVLSFGELSIRNDFDKFELSDDSDESEDLKQYILKEGIAGNEKKAMISFSSYYNYVAGMKGKLEMYALEDERGQISSGLAEFFSENNITNDIELFEFAIEKDNFRNNIFTSVKRMKAKYMLLQTLDVALPETSSITFIDGDYQGYIYNFDNFREVSILEGDNRYIITFLNTKYFTGAYVKELLNTVKIKSAGTL